MDRRKWHENMRLRLYRTTRDGAQATRGTGKMLYAVPVDSSWWQIRVGAETGPAIAEVKEETDARRIVAAVNAVDGIATESLESGVVREMIEALEAVVYQYDTPWDRHRYSIGMAKAVLAKVRGEQP